MHAGILSFTEMSAGKPAAWYLVSAASVVILLLPFLATPLTWVAVELLKQQASNSASASELIGNRIWDWIGFLL